MSDVRRPLYKIVYNGRDITEDISDDALSIAYEDAEGGESDEIRILIDDMFGKWKDEWRPHRGDTIDLSIGYAGEGLSDLGRFEIDEVHFRGQPDVVEFRALSVGIDNTLWTVNSKAWDNATIYEVASEIAGKNTLTLIYNLSGPSSLTASTDLRTNAILQLRHRRFYQDRETDLGFLNRIANRYGIRFSVKGQYLTYILVYDLHSIPPITDLVSSELYQPFFGRFEQSFESSFIDRTIDDIIERPRPELKSYDLRDCVDKDAQGVDVKNFDPYAQTGYIYRLNAGDELESLLAQLLPNYTQAVRNIVGVRSKRGTEELFKVQRRIQVYEEVENLKQAEVMAMARLYEAGTSTVEGSVEFEGTPVVQAGTNIQIRGLRWLDGKYHVTKSFHRIDRNSGYTTRAEVRMVGLLDD